MWQNIHITDNATSALRIDLDLLNIRILRFRNWMKIMELWALTANAVHEIARGPRGITVCKNELRQVLNPH